MKKNKVAVDFLIIIMLLFSLTGCGFQTRKDINTGRSENIHAKNTVHPAKDDLFTPGTVLPRGARRDSRGYIVMPDGNTFDKEGGWQVPEGGYVDSKGRIHDKNGKLLGGGAEIGSKG